MNQINHDKELIYRLGGTTKVAQLLGYDGYGVQRVQNWVKRGIPSKVKLEFPHIFLQITPTKTEV